MERKFSGNKFSLKVEVISFILIQGFNGLSYTTLADNQTFFLTLNCYTEWNQMTWSVASVTPTLSKETVQLIHKNVQSFGFKKEQFTGIRYDTCPDVQLHNGPSAGHGWNRGIMTS